MSTYVAYSERMHAYKIGRSADEAGRIAHHRTAVPDIELVASYEQDLERELHAAFARCCVGGEWYDLGRDGLERIDQVARRLTAPEDSPESIALAEDMLTVPAPRNEAELIIRAVVDATAPGQFIPTHEFIGLLRKLQREENVLQWADWLRDNVVAARRLGRLLAPYGLKAEQKWIEDRNQRAFSSASFHAWADRLASR